MENRQVSCLPLRDRDPQQSFALSQGVQLGITYESNICDAQMQYRNESRDFHVTTETADLIYDSIEFPKRYSGKETTCQGRRHKRCEFDS